MREQILPIICLFLLGFTGCSKDNNKEFTDTPVIESYLIPGKVPVITVSRQVPFTTDATYAADNINALHIFFSCNGAEYELTSLGDGIYQGNSIIEGSGTVCTLRFEYNGKTVSALTTIPSKPDNFTQSVTELTMERQDSTSGPPGGSMPDPVTLSWDNTDGTYYIVVIDCIETALDPIRDFGDNEPPGNRFREAPTTAAGLEIRPMEFQYFGKHRLILYHVLPDYASLYEESNSSSLNLTNPSTSIINGYGIFTAMEADTLYLNINEE